MALVALGVAGAVGCSRCGGQDEKREVKEAVEPPVQAPEGLVAELQLPTPNESWGKLQRAVGGAAGILPSTLGGLVCAFAALDAGLGPEIDGTAPAHGVVAGDPDHLEWILAAKLVDPRKARALLVDGDVARFTAREHGSLTELVPRGAPPPVSVALARGGFLLVAGQAETLERLGPYATRTLPTRAAAPHAAIVDLPRALFARVGPWVERTWGAFRKEKLAQDDAMRTAHGGRAPDFADPKAIVSALDGALTNRLAVVGDLERAKVTVDVAEHLVQVHLDATPREGEGPASSWVGGLAAGDREPLDDAPADAALVSLSRSRREARVEDADGWKKSIGAVLGERLPEGDRKRIDAVVDDWTAARGDVLLAGAFAGGPSGAFARAPVGDAAAATRALGGVVDLLKLPLLRDAAKLEPPTLELRDVPSVGKVHVARVQRAEAKGRPADPKAKPPALGLAWAVEGGAATVAAGEEPADLVTRVAHPSRRVRDEAAIQAALRMTSAQPTLLLVAQPLLLDPKRANLPVAPVVVGVGRADRALYVDVIVADGVLREVARRQIGL